ncbi:MAG: FAD-dependent oxidoreductase [Patescibacteria group bacterium]
MADIIIIGSGIAGLSASLYSARYELSTVVIGDILGGATSSAWTVENYPGFEAIDGYDLIVKVRDQVAKLGVQIATDRVVDIDKIADGFVLKTEAGETHQGKTVIFAVGAARRKLNLPKEDDFAQGRGVHYCTTCDGPLYKNKTIGVVGGGDAATKGLVLASQYAAKIHVFVRSDHLRAGLVNMEHLAEPIKKGQIEIHYHTEIAELLGDDKLTGVKFKDGKTLELDGLFVEIGAIPEVALTTKLGIELDEYGYLRVNNMMETNVPGTYAAGDTTNFFGHFKQDITAAAMGSVAATSAFNFIQKHST